MIGRLTGTLIEKKPPHLVVDIQGVGYEVEAPMTTFYQLPKLGQPVTLYTHFVVREDAQLLYGFADNQERTLFRTLIKASGVGPKLALAILSGIESEQFVRCVQQGDSAALIKIPGVGKKTAERLLVEVGDKLDGLLEPHDLLNPAPQSGHADMSADLAVQDAESALVALGYKPAQASKAVKAVVAPGLASEELIRRALKSMI